jgi:SAM-dependent methyltransferase
VDVSARQLATVHRLQDEFGLRFPLVQGDAERVPLGAGCADLVISEYGASVWCDPYRWIPEAARLLRPGGRLVFMAQSTLARMCMPEQGPATDRRGPGAARRHQQRLSRVSGRVGPALAGRGGLVRPPLICPPRPSANQPDRGGTNQRRVSTPPRRTERGVRVPRGRTGLAVAMLTWHARPRWTRLNSGI